MRTAIDATLADEPTTGIGLYGTELAKALAEGGEAPERWGARLSGEVPRGNTGRAAWTIGILPRELAQQRPALYHAIANHNLPLCRVNGVAYVLTLHDIIPHLLPEAGKASSRWLFRTWLPRALQVAHRVICVSHTTRRDVIAEFGADPSKLSVIPLGVDHVARTVRPSAADVQWFADLQLPKSFVLAPGALDKRKNLNAVFDACEELQRRRRRIALIVPGQRWFGADAYAQRGERLRAMGIDVRFTGYLSAPRLYGLMVRALAVLFMSHYEGFGLPPLEAMALGVPVIASNKGALPEVLGDAAIQLAPDDIRGIADAIERLSDNASLRVDFASRGRKRAGRYQWARTAKATRETYRLAVAPK